MSYTMTLYVERGEDELELEVTGSVSEYIPAVTHKLPEDCHPAEGGEVEIEKITLDGEEWGGELTDDERERAEEGLFEQYRSNDVGYIEEYEDDDLDIQEIPEHF